MKLLLATFWVGVVSAVFPLVNMEAYVIGVAAVVGDLDIWLVALVGGIGQALGKIPWYEVSRSSMNWAYVRRKLSDPGWGQRFQSVHDRVADRPWVALAVVFTSSLIAVPPLAVTAVLAGQLRCNRVAFYGSIVVGRTVQFAALLLGIDALMHL
jgi:membrane protein YqaA with SNARE-associated domain